MGDNIVTAGQNRVWLASYPKSGNTWFRAFLTALLNKESDVDINNMVIDQIFSSRKALDDNTDLRSTYLTNDEAKLLQPKVFGYLAANATKARQYTKVHDAYTLNTDKQPIIPTQGTQCAVYIVRNPLDIAGSLAAHKNTSIDNAIALMNDSEGRFSQQKNNLNIKVQTEQLLLDWSGHVNSWTEPLPFPVMVIRYEEMLGDTFNTFKAAINFLGIAASQQQLKEAINASSFKQLKQKEQEKGFVERTNAESFFRKGMAGSWQQELSPEQIKTILSSHQTVMEKYGYT